MINMKGFKAYLLLALLIVLLIGFIAAGKTSPSYSPPVVKTINCNTVNLNFSAATKTDIVAKTGTNTFFNIPINNTGNVTETIGLKVVSNNAPFTVESAPSFRLNASKSGYTSFGIYSPTRTGNYSLYANVSASYLNCVNYKNLPINVTIRNSSS